MNNNNPTIATTGARHFVVLTLVGIAICLTFASSVQAEADLQITAMSLQGQGRQGTCNKVSMTVKNFGDEFTGNATLDIALITYTTGNSNLNRVTKSLYISPLQPNGQSSFTIDDVEFKASGQMTIQGLVDSTNETPEGQNENNNSRTANVNVSGTCVTQTPNIPTPTNQGCDIEATFVAPSGTTVPPNQAYTYQVRFTNKGTSNCDAFKVKLVRTNNTTCSGYGSQVGGSRNWQSIGTLGRNANTTANFSEAKTPRGGKACLYLGYSPHNYSDTNNSNHRPKKAISYQ
ncbi:MAG: hypothetical protein K8J08_10375 [Thermoanaerobaculia bacterium]|nr:hypothetical protein [Thermoanaerobaculia bacterium]